MSGALCDELSNEGRGGEREVTITVRKQIMEGYKWVEATSEVVVVVVGV